MGYDEVTFAHPRVRAEEYNLLYKLGISCGTQYPRIDTTLNIPNCPDVGLSFINLHHLPPEDVIADIAKLGFGTYYAMEIVKYSRQAQFLDHYVGKFRAWGHRGHYIHPNYFEEIAGYAVEYKEYDYHWHFTPPLAVKYCDRLFNIKSDGLIDALVEYLNYDGQKIDWKLGVAQLSKK